MLSKQATTTLGLVAAVLVLLGAVLGFMSITASGYDCGAAFTGYDAPSYSVGQECADARSGRRVLALTVLIGGVALGLGTAVIIEPKRSSEKEGGTERTAT